jgi:hypothetical protein
MDTPTILAYGGTSSALVVAAALVWKISSAILGHRYISECCGRRYSFGVAEQDYTGNTSSPLNPGTGADKPLLQSP